MPDREILNAGIAVVIFLFAIITLLRAVKVVPQSQVYVVERFGKYIRTLAPGMSVVVPYIDAVRHRISILERQLEEFTISIITKDNVEIRMETTVFFMDSRLDCSSSNSSLPAADRTIEEAAVWIALVTSWMR